MLGYVEKSVNLLKDITELIQKYPKIILAIIIGIIIGVLIALVAIIKFNNQLSIKSFELIQYKNQVSDLNKRLNDYVSKEVHNLELKQKKEKINLLEKKIESTVKINSSLEEKLSECKNNEIKRLKKHLEGYISKDVYNFELKQKSEKIDLLEEELSKKSVLNNSLKKELTACENKEKCIITINSNVLGDKLYIDNKLYGSTPFPFETYKNSSHLITISKEGYLTKKRNVVCTDNNEIRIYLDKECTMSIYSNVNNDEVLIDGKHSNSKTPYYFKTTTNKIHTITVEKDGYESVTKENCKCSNNIRETRFDFNLEKNTCLIRIHSDVLRGGDTVKIDGLVVGSTPYNFNTKIGKLHKIIVSNGNKEILKSIKCDNEDITLNFEFNSSDSQ